MRAARASHSATATRPDTAAKDIWKPGSIRLSGRSSRMIAAASATDRIDSAGRSNRIAISIIASMMKARVAGVAAPLMTR